MKYLVLALLLVASPLHAAIAHIGAIIANTCNEVVSDTVLDCVTSADLEAGNVMVLEFVTDNLCNTTATATSNTTEHSSVTVGGIAARKIREVCSDVDGGAGNGATVSVWVYRNATGSTISTGAAVVFTTASAVDAKAGAAREFTVAANNTLQSAGGEQDVAYDTADVGSATISGLVSKEYLFFRAIGTEGDSNTATTVTTNYTNWTLSTAQGGTSALSAQTRGEHRILTATGDSSDPATPDQDETTTYIALEEVSTLRSPVAPFIFQ